MSELRMTGERTFEVHLPIGRGFGPEVTRALSAKQNLIDSGILVGGVGYPKSGAASGVPPNEVVHVVTAAVVVADTIVVSCRVLQTPRGEALLPALKAGQLKGNVELSYDGALEFVGVSLEVTDNKEKVIFTLGMEAWFNKVIQGHEGLEKQEGCAVWKTSEEARDYIARNHLIGYAVYPVQANWATDTEDDSGSDGSWMKLRKRARIIPCFGINVPKQRLDSEMIPGRDSPVLDKIMQLFDYLPKIDHYYSCHGEAHSSQDNDRSTIKQKLAVLLEKYFSVDFVEVDGPAEWKPKGDSNG